MPKRKRSYTGEAMILPPIARFLRWLQSMLTHYGGTDNRRLNMDRYWYVQKGERFLVDGQVQNGCVCKTPLLNGTSHPFFGGTRTTRATILLGLPENLIGFTTPSPTNLILEYGHPEYIWKVAPHTPVTHLRRHLTHAHMTRNSLPVVKSTNDTELCGNFLLFIHGEHLPSDPNHGNRDGKSKLISVD